MGVIGAGVTGTALAYQLFRKGYRVIAVNSRTLTSAQRLASFVTGCTICNTPQQVADMAQAIFITTPDDKIAGIAEGIVEVAYTDEVEPETRALVTEAEEAITQGHLLKFLSQFPEPLD